MSGHGSRYFAILDPSGIILCQNTLDIMAVIVKICNNIQIFYCTCILLDQRFLQAGYGISGAIQCSAEIRCRKIRPAICLDIFCQAEICSLICLNKVKIIDRRDLIRMS